MTAKPKDGAEGIGWVTGRGLAADIGTATGVGTLMSVFELDPMKALLWSAIVNGVISVPIMVVMMWIGQSRRLMGALTMSRRHRAFGRAATGVVALALLFMLATGF